MSDTNFCPQCGLRLAPAAPHGLCPGCLFQEALQGTHEATACWPEKTRADHTPPAPSELASQFPDLEILEVIGRGGMGIVYKARQKSLDRLVALKILSPAIARDPAFAERFSREARVMALLSHPHVVAVYDFGTTSAPDASSDSPPLCYLLMEYVDGLTLRQLLNSGQLSATQALAIVPQICAALQYAHDKGIVHRDIKPENILLDRAGNVKIADFGLAKLLALDHHELTISRTGQVLGTLHYMAPEQMERPTEVDHRADIYSLGVVFYQMLTGELPLGKFQPPSQRVVVDARLDEVVLRALEREPDRRYQRASALQSQVESISANPSTISGSVHTTRKRLQAWLPAGKRRLALLAALGILLACGAFWTANRISRPDSNLNPAGLANVPWELKRASKARVIEALTANPETPWTWQELESRSLSATDDAQIMQGLIRWLRTEHPRGLRSPLSWSSRYLNRMDGEHRITDAEKVEFLECLYGDLRGPRQARIMAGSSWWHPQIELKSVWHDDLLGMAFMNELLEMKIDGEPVSLQPTSQSWKTGRLAQPLTLPILAPGRHEVTLTVFSALVPTADLVGISDTAPHTQWPRALKSWQRSCQIPLLVVESQNRNFKPVTKSEFSPVGRGLAINSIVIRGNADLREAGIEFTIDRFLPVSIACDVTLKIGDERIPCGSIFAILAESDVPSVDEAAGPQPALITGKTILSAQIPAGTPDATTADLILTPNPNLLEPNPYADSYWAETIVFSHVALRRADR
ncbi:MAG: serine/threonine protein kinase [Planctomycetes bacterium]|nr:serine/threonine protein kinase [Planctomycetota bacterium]